MSDPDVAIVGVGLHPFGRYPGKSAMEMGEDAVYEALTDAGVKWEDVEALYAGSMEVKNPEGIVGLLGQTGVPGRAVFTGCATGATSLAMAANAIRLGDADVAIAIGLDKHPRGAFSDDPSVSGLPLWYGQAGLFLTTHFFGMKINRYMHDHGITSATLAKVAAKAFRNGAQTHHAWRRKPLTEDEILNSQVLNYPLTQYMYCGPNEGAAAAVLVRADQARQYTDTPVYIRASTLRSRREGAFELLSPSFGLDIVPGPTVEASREAYELAGIGPGTAFVKALAHARLFYTFIKSPTFGQWVFSPGATFGIGTTLDNGAGSELPLYERFFPGGVGGQGDVRGYQLYSLGPQVLLLNQFGAPQSIEDIGGSKELLLNGEITFPILSGLGIRGVVFADAGQAYRLSDSITVASLQASYGIGIRWRSPFGPIAVDVARPINPRPQDQSNVFEIGGGAPL